MRICRRLSLSVLLVGTIGGTAGCSGPVDSISLAEWRVEEIGSIGGELPEYSFNRIANVSTDHRGHIYVADAGDSRVRVYSSDGSHVRDIGQSGRGPGEFARLVTAGVYADTVYAVDVPLQRVTLFDTVGAVLATIRNPTYHGAPTVVSELYADGRRLVIPAYRPGDTAAVPRLLMWPDERAADTLGFVKPGRMLRFRVGDAEISGPDPFALPEFLPISPQGDKWARIELQDPTRSGLYPVSIAVKNVGGADVWRSTVEFPALSLSEAEADSIADALVERLKPRGVPAQDVRAALDVPRFKPPVLAAIFAEDGSLWIRTVTATSDQAAWMVLDSSGTAIARLEMPMTFRPSRIAGNRIVGVAWDEFDVQRVAIYRIVRCAQTNDGADCV